MMSKAFYSQGKILLAFLVFTGGQGTKRRPVLAVRDFGDIDLLELTRTWSFLSGKLLV